MFSVPIPVQHLNWKTGMARMLPRTARVHNLDMEEMYGGSKVFLLCLDTDSSRHNKPPLCSTALRTWVL